MNDLPLSTPSKVQLGVMLHLTPQGSQSANQTYAEFTDLIQSIDSMGFDEAWVTEHHFAAYSLTSAPLIMMGHFLAHTRSVKLGAAAVLLGFHNPIEIAEQLATLHSLYPQRVLCGFAKGGPFESQNAAFKMSGDISRAHLEEAVPALMSLLNCESATHTGQYYQWENIELQPKSQFDGSQFLLATSHATTVQLAANLGMGLMSAQFWDAPKIAENIQVYQQYHPQGKKPDMMVARGLFMDDNPQLARDKALHHIESFRVQKSQLWGQHRGPMHHLDQDQLLSRMLCGSIEQVIQQVEELLDLGVTRLALNPLTSNHVCRINQLERFSVEVWPFVRQNQSLAKTEVGSAL